MESIKSQFMQNIKTELNKQYFTTYDIDTVQGIVDKILENYTIRTNVEISKIITDENLILDRYYEEMRSTNMSDGTIAVYSLIHSEFLKFVKKPLLEITAEDVQSFLDNKFRLGAQSSTVRQNRTAISSMFEYLLKKGYVDKNPVSDTTKIKLEQKIKVPYTSVEIDALRSACKSTRNSLRNLAIIDFLNSTGCRVSELCNLKLVDLDLSNNTAKIICGKERKSRFIFFNELAASTLRMYLEERKQNVGDTSPYVFRSIRTAKMTPSSVQNLIRTLRKTAHVSEAYPHKFRRTVITKLVNRGASPFKIATIVGHARLDTTKIYFSPQLNDLKSEYMKYSD